MEPTEKSRRERFKVHFNFITLHYCYLIGMSLVLSVIIFAGSNMPYIDALFFASGACTQSGLNTIDTNSIKTYQQSLIYIATMLTTPIFINTCVVRIRLHWFEKRFENIVSMSRQPSRARTITQGRKEATALEDGIQGRDIRVLHQDTMNSGKFEVVEGPEGMIMQRSSTANTAIDPKAPMREEEDNSSHGGASSSTMAELPSANGNTATASRNPPGTASSNIQFSDLPSPRTRDGTEDYGWNAANNNHIAFVESQRAPQNGKALRIPGPREFEKGDRATEVDDDDTYTLAPARTGEETRVGHTPSRSYSFSAAATNASMRLRKLPTADRILPHATAAMTSAFSMGPAKRVRSFSVFSNTPRKPVPVPDMPYLSYQPTLGRNSQFVDLTDEQRDELGGIEYRSLKLLFRVLVAYYVCFHAFGIICILPWIHNAPQYKEYIQSLGVSPTWWAIFTSQTSLNDLGFTLTPDSMLSFQKCTWILVVMTFLIVIGNTGFPCLLRFLIWLLFKIVPAGSSIKEALNFLLDHPRRCFTLLFPSRETWVLLWVLLALNIADVILFIVLDIKDPDVTSIAVGHRIMGAIFQAASTRTAGLAVVNISALHPAVQVSYMLMMYISVFPIAISVRRTNVYEEKSLGLYGGDDDMEAGPSGASYVGFHLRKQLSFDLWYIFLGLFVISIAEGRHIENINDYAFTVFSVLFEVVSAYGTVGLSLGYPGFNPSFSGKFSVVSKLVIIAMQLRGRHRGLPYELDRAVLLPKEQRDAELSSIRRRGSTISTAHPFPNSFSRPIPSQAVDD
ncbi:cation transport protein-domain-containing protein [Tricharina praecox]|uniref:cation transport protein-domain-containing protein n=1 Tax=Tricharina praecox TaxID=43433 RepID=UPI00221F0B53|nr:cation transport protein-domain-containing protein [Tricharina praecox]KAI5854369.1 cation transport protein-domain-containing protein [Tricharina praecox]